MIVCGKHQFQVFFVSLWGETKLPPKVFGEPSNKEVTMNLEFDLDRNKNMKMNKKQDQERTYSTGQTQTVPTESQGLRLLQTLGHNFINLQHTT